MSVCVDQMWTNVDLMWIGVDGCVDFLWKDVNGIWECYMCDAGDVD